MKILLFGSSGQVGWELQRALAPLGEVAATTREEGEGLRGDLAKLDAVAATVRQFSPDVIVNAAAYTAVDKAEDEPEQAELINAVAPGVLAREAREVGAWLVHYSTDYVFDGAGKRPWRENDTTSPLNEYGRTKRRGELAIQSSGCQHLIFRTSWVYAVLGKNFIKTMLRLAAEREALHVIDDQHGAPTGAALIADVTAHALLYAMRHPGCGGLYHLAASGETSWYGFCRRVLEKARFAGWPARVAEDAVIPITTDAFPTRARRPGNSRLDCSHLEEVFRLHLPPWQLGVDHALSEILAREHHVERS